MGVCLGNIFPSKFLLKKKDTSHGGVVFAQIGAWVTIFGLQSAHEKGGGRARPGQSPRQGSCHGGGTSKGYNYECYCTMVESA